MDRNALWVLPVSGGLFPVQLTQAMWILEAGYKPLALFSSSGGNVVSYLIATGNFFVDRISLITKYLSSRIIIRSWWPAYLSYLPTGIKGIFTGSIYRINPKFYDYFKCIYTISPPTIEIWTGIYNKTTNKTQLVCNLSKEEAFFSAEESANLLNVMPTIYANNDINILSSACLASASVPTIFPAVKIGEYNYIDGGDSYSSPLSVLASSVKEKKITHMVYFSPKNIDEIKINDTNQATSIYSNGKYALSSLLHSLSIQDRISGIKSVVGDSYQYAEYPCVSKDEFKIFLSIFMAKNKAFIELYPYKQASIDMTNFEGYDILKIVEQTDKMGFRCWYN